MRSTVRRVAGQLAALTAAVTLLALLPLASFPTAASATAPPQFVPPFCEPGSGAGQCNDPSGIGVDPKTGHLFVADKNNARIVEFTSLGKFIRAWGWGVVASGPDNKPQNERQELTVSATGGSYRLRFINTFLDGGSKQQETTPIAYNAPAGKGEGAGSVEAALEGLESPVPGDITVSGGPGDAGGTKPYTIEFTGKYTDADIPPLQPVSSTLTGGAATATVKTIQGGANYEICIPANGDVCRAGQSGGPSPGQFTGAQGVAVDSSDDIYVFDSRSEGEKNARVQKFDSAGNFLLMFGGEVNKTTKANICTKANLVGGDECGLGTIGTGNGQFANTEVGNYVAAGPAGTIFVGDKGRIQEFGPDGKFKGEVKLSEELAGKTVQQLALDGAGNFYVVLGGEEMVLGGEEKVRKLNPTGKPGEPKSFPVAGVLKGPGAIALDSAGDVYAVEDPPTFGSPKLDPRVVEFDPAGNKLIPDAEEAEKEKFFAQEGANVGLSGLATSHCEGGEGLGALYVSVRSGHISAYGSDPGCEGPEVEPPTIETQYAASVGTTSAVLKAEINPHFSPSTTYYVRYGLEECEGAVEPCEEQPPAPGDPLGAEGGIAVATAGVPLSGLSPGTTYHYSFVAIGECEAGKECVVPGEDRTFTTFAAPQPEECLANAAFRVGASANLPDCRAYEMVSPPQKNSAELAPQGGTGNALLQASPSGEAISYKSSTAFGEAVSAPQNNQYLSGRKSSGWSTQNITPPDQGGRIENAVRGFSPDLSRTVLVVLEPPLCCGATPGVDNLYLRDNASGALTLLTDVEPTIPKGGEGYCVAYGGASADFGRVIFAAFGALTPDAPEGNGFSLYEWSAAEGLRLVSVLPTGMPASPSSGIGFGAAGVAGGDGGCRMGRGNVQHAISADGSRIFWTLGGGAGLFARLGGSETVQLDLPQGGPGPPGGGQFWAASADGSKVIFTDQNKLTAGANAQDLYRYDFDAPKGERLSDLSAASKAAGVQGVLGASEAGDYVYFVANGVLAENEGAAVELQSGLPQKAKAGQNNLYLWHEGQPLRFIARLAPGEVDNANWQPGPEFRSPRVSPDGRHLAFLSIEALTGFDNTKQGSGEAVKDVYLYGAEEDELLCASCNPSEARPLGAAALTNWKLPYEQPRFLSDGGGRLFFESFDALDPRDTNDVRDVYEFEREGVGGCTSESATFSAASGGCLALISSGVSDEDSYFIDASSSGDDVFISTRQQLVGADVDERYDIYDARAGGGFPEPLPPPICEGEGCRGEGTRAPSPSPAGTPGFVGPLDPSPARCRKGKVRRNGKCVSRHRKAKHRKRARHHRANRDRRAAK